MKDEDFSDYQQSVITTTQYLRCAAGAEYVQNSHMHTGPTNTQKGYFSYTPRINE